MAGWLKISEEVRAKASTAAAHRISKRQLAKWRKPQRGESENNMAKDEEMAAESESLANMAKLENIQLACEMKCTSGAAA